MKRFLMIFLVISLLFIMTSCGENTNTKDRSYNYAIIYLPNGTIIEGNITGYTIDYAAIKVIIDGTPYYTSKSNILLTRR